MGAESGGSHTGRASRNGGSTRAQGVNLSLVARVPIGGFSAFANLGALRGQTRVSADAAGGGLDCTPQMGLVRGVDR